MTGQEAYRDIEVGKALGVPMSLIDGRPWVPTPQEMAGWTPHADFCMDSWMLACRCGSDAANEAIAAAHPCAYPRDADGGCSHHHDNICQP